MKKIYKSLILLTAIMSLSFSVEASEPAKKVNLSINNIIGTYSVNNKETTIANSETAAATLSLDTSNGLYLYDKSGNVYYQDTDGQSYIDGLAPNHYAYDKNGAQMNSLYAVRDKYIVKFNSASASDAIVFDSFKDRDVFISWYQLEVGIEQGNVIHWSRTADNKAKIRKQEFLKIPSTKDPEYTKKVASIVNKLNEYPSQNEKILKATELVANTFTYDCDYMTLDINKAVKDGKGVCYHYAKLLHDVFDAAGIKNELMLGSTSMSNRSHVWNRAYDDENNTWVYADAITKNIYATTAKINKLDAYLGYYFQATLE